MDDVNGFAVGIDPGTANIGLCAMPVSNLPSPPFCMDWVRLPSLPKNSPCEQRIARIYNSINQINAILFDVLERELCDASLIVIEGYSHASKYSAHSMGEFGGIFRLIAGAPIVEIAPTTLKKFATQNGRASKQEMQAAIRRAPHFVGGAPSSHEIDAYFLAVIGRIALSSDFNETVFPLTVYQKEVIDRVKDSLMAPQAKETIC